MARVKVENPNGRARILLVCEHASRFLPAEFGDLGLDEAALSSHCAWDIGAAALAEQLSARLDAPLIRAATSRLVLDANRALDAPDLIPARAEDLIISGNEHISEGEKSDRIARFHEPFHDAITGFLASRADITALISVHTFTPELRGQKRPWHAGLLYENPDAQLADLVHGALAADGALTIGRNQPYAPADGVYYTMNRHARPRGLASLMIEVRNDLVLLPDESAAWAGRLARAISAALASVGAARTRAAL